MTKDAVKDDLKKKIEQLLRVAPRQLLTLRSDTLERAYEAYIWSLCKEAVERAGGSAVLKGILSGEDVKKKEIVLRGAPGNMSGRQHDFCYIDCCLNGKEFEIHLDVQYEGTSGASHEVDVSIYDHAGAAAVREKKNGLPKSGKLLMVIECKCYTSNAVSTELGRCFVGLIKDCNGSRMNAFVSNKSTANLNNYFRNKTNIQPFTDLDPAQNAAAERFVHVVEQALRKWAG